MYKERETKLKTYNRSLQCQIVSLKEEKEIQKHPTYPLHWGGYDGAASAYPEQYSKWLNEQRDKAIKEKYDKNIIDFVESEFSNEDPLEGKQVEFNAEELLKRVTEYADTLNNLPKSFPNEFQKEKSWEEAASDLALKVAKLEEIIENQLNQIEDIKAFGNKLTKMTYHDSYYEYFKKNGKWPW